MTPTTEPVPAILDVDGTLVDTNYHHALAWFRAFKTNGVHVSVWRIHRHIGLAGDLFVEAVAGSEVDASKGRRSERPNPSSTAN